MRQINVKFVVILFVLLAVGGGGIFALNRWQVSRNAGSLFTRAEAALESGDKGEALQLLSRYVGMRPNDSRAYGLFAELLLEAAEAPGAGRAEFSRAYSALETAVRQDPDNLYLRQRLAQFQIFINRPADAREHLTVLRERASSPDGEAGNAPGVDENGSDADDSKRLLSAGEIDVLLARALMGTGRFDEAAEVLAERIAYDRSARGFRVPVEEAAKGNTDAYILMAALLDDELRATSEADAVLDRLVEVNADDARAWLAMRGWHAQRGDMAAATEDVRRAIEIAPDDLETLLAEFELKLAQQAFADAQAAATKAAKLFPNEERVVRAEAILALRQGDRQQAFALLESGLKRMPGQVALLMMLADTQLQVGDVASSETTVELLTKLVGGSNPAVGLLTARVNMAQQKWLEAQQLLETVRPQANPNSDTTRQIDLYLGQCYEKLGQFDRQLEANQRVLSGDPNSVAARIGAAAALAASGRKDQALAEYEVIFNAMAPDDVSAFAQLWNPLLQLRIDSQLTKPSAERSWTDVDALVELLGASPRINDAQIAILRADVMVRKEQGREAVSLLREALGKDPASQPLLGALLTLALRFEGVDAAKAILEESPAESRKTVAVMTLEASVAARDTAENGAAALAALETRVAELPTVEQPAVINAIASAYGAIGRPDDAVRAYRSLLERTPDNLTTWDALFRLAEQRGNIELAEEASRSIARLAGDNSAEAKVAEAATLMLKTRLAAAARAETGVEAALDASASDALQKTRALLIEAETTRKNWAEVQLRFADVALAERDLETAISRLKQAARLAPGNTLITRRMVSLLHAADRIEEAVEAMALLRPEDMQGLERITADIQFRGGNFDKAVAIAETAVSDTSDNVADLTWLGQLLTRSGDTARAISLYKRAVEIAPTEGSAWLALVSLQAADGKTDEAAANLAKATAALASPDRELVAAQGDEVLGRYDQAEETLRQSTTAADGDAIQAGQALASFLIRRGRLDDAEQELQTIVNAPTQKNRDRPVKLWARRTLAELLADRGTYRELEKAIALIDENGSDGGGLSPEDISLQIRLLAARLEPACWRQAIERLDDLEDLQPLSIQQKLLEAQLLEKLGRWDEARTAYISLLGTTNPPPLVFAALIEKLIAHDELTTASMWLDRLEQQAADAPITLALTAKLAVAQDDRDTAVEAAKGLMPTETLPDERLGELRNTAMLMEDLGFSKAADQLWQDFAARSVDGVLGRAEFLGRQKQTAEALDLVDAAWDQLPLERILQSGVVIARNEGGVSPSEPTVTRLDGWFTKARRVDPGSVTLALLEAEFRELEGRSSDVEAIYRDLMARDDLAVTQKAIVANNLAFHLAKPDTIDEAAALIESAISQLGPHPDLLDTRGLVSLVKGEAEKSVEDLEEAVLAPTAAKYLHLAQAQLAGQQVAAARRSLEQAKELGLEPERLSRSDRARLEQVEAALAAPIGA